MPQIQFNVFTAYPSRKSKQVKVQWGILELLSRGRMMKVLMCFRPNEFWRSPDLWPTDKSTVAKSGTSRGDPLGRCHLLQTVSNIQNSNVFLSRYFCMAYFNCVLYGDRVSGLYHVLNYWRIFIKFHIAVDTKIDQANTFWVHTHTHTHTHHNTPYTHTTHTHNIISVF